MRIPIRHATVRFGPPAAEPPGRLRFPTEDTSGLSQFPDWTPTQTLGSTTITTPGAVYEDVEFTGTVVVAATGVTLRRCLFNDARLTNDQGNVIFGGLLLEDCTSTYVDESGGIPAFSASNYTARRCALLDVGEGFRVGSVDDPGSGPVLIEDCYVRITKPAGHDNWHGDALQGFGGGDVTVRNCTFVNPSPPDDVGTSPFWWPDQGNVGKVVVDGLICQGGGYSFRLQELTRSDHTINGLHVVRDAWRFGSHRLEDAQVAEWEAFLCDLDADGQPINLTPLEM